MVTKDPQLNLDPAEVVRPGPARMGLHVGTPSLTLAEKKMHSGVYDFADKLAEVTGGPTRSRDAHGFLCEAVPQALYDLLVGMDPGISDAVVEAYGHFRDEAKGEAKGKGDKP